MLISIYKPNLNVLTVRHGESVANVNKSAYKKTANRLIELTEEGHKQAIKTGIFLATNFNIHNKNTLIFSSSYKRVLQTTTDINTLLSLQVRIDDRLTGQNYGLFEGLSKKEQFKIYPNEAKRFYKQKQLDNEFFTPTPMGESPFDISLRFNSFWKDIEPLTKIPNIENVIIIAHNLTNLIIQKDLMNYSVDWFLTKKHIPNCGVSYFKLSKTNNCVQDMGLIYMP